MDVLELDCFLWKPRKKEPAKNLVMIRRMRKVIIVGNHPGVFRLSRALRTHGVSNFSVHYTLFQHHVWIPKVIKQYWQRALSALRVFFFFFWRFENVLCFLGFKSFHLFKALHLDPERAYYLLPKNLRLKQECVIKLPVSKFLCRMTSNGD